MNMKRAVCVSTYKNDSKVADALKWIELYIYVYTDL